MMYIMKQLVELEQAPLSFITDFGALLILLSRQLLKHILRPVDLEHAELGMEN